MGIRKCPPPHLEVLKQPWAEETFATKLWAKVRAGERPPLTADDESRAPNGYVALMRELWHQDPVERPTFAEALRRLRAMVGRQQQATWRRPRRR